MKPIIKINIKLAEKGRPLSSYKHGEVISSFNIEVSNYKPKITWNEFIKSRRNFNK